MGSVGPHTTDTITLYVFMYHCNIPRMWVKTCLIPETCTVFADFLLEDGQCGYSSKTRDHFILTQ